MIVLELAVVLGHVGTVNFEVGIIQSAYMSHALVVRTQYQFFSLEISIQHFDHESIVRGLLRLMVRAQQKTDERVVLGKGKDAAVLERLRPFDPHKRASHLADVLDAPAGGVRVPLDDESADDIFFLAERFELVGHICLHLLQPHPCHHPVEHVYFLFGHVRLDLYGALLDV